MRTSSSRTRSADFQDQRVVAPHGFERGGVDLEPQARGETDGAQQAQMIFAETGIGVADGADHAPLQIGAPAHVIEHFPVSGSIMSPLMVKSRRSTSSRGSLSKCTLAGRRPSA
jgi:hypothetical protein